MEAFGSRHHAVCADTVRLICLPFAGGSAAAFRDWGAALGPRFPTVPVDLPGHGRRIREPLCDSLDALAELLVTELSEELESGPYAIFGHSLGGLLAVQMAHELARRHLPPPVRLFISAARSPAEPRPRPLHELPDAALLDALVQLAEGVPAIDGHRELLQFMLPVLRADLRMAETWAGPPSPPLAVPVSLLSGVHDLLAPPTRMASWRRSFVGEVAAHSYPGGHFYIETCADAVLQDVGRALSRAADE
ncbi:thioesterase [Micromonospora aurantiaca]|uniref:thioesterase II family protein n=1 Tax=Micromonospora aurantiaca (nom. illeg.) TaxID=47850 RepID=UPI000F41B226|nr:alpha/beta fold hydrolase [Micromonospora aurantiaca]RNH97596.1 thioesterase [Micromonospora aurantiaca]